MVRDLAHRAGHYKRLIDPTQEPGAPKPRLIDPTQEPGAPKPAAAPGPVGAQTTYPLFMHGFELLDRGQCTIEELRQVASFVKGFLVRRHLAGVPTNALNSSLWP